MKVEVFYTIVFSWVLSIEGAYGCILPTDWDGEWHDSSDTTKDITFTRSTNNVIGWSTTVSQFISGVTSWTCVDDDPNKNLLLFQSDQIVYPFTSVSTYISRCLKWEKLTEFTYTYLIYEVSFLLIHTAPANITSYCNVDDAFKPTAIGTIVLVKKGYIEYAAQNCPTPFMGSFNYVFNDGSTTYCDSTSKWDVCSNPTQMVINYTLCSTTQFFSNNGIAYCVYSTSVGSTYYVTVVNADITVDFTTTFRFTCFAVKSSDGFVYASDNKGACVPEQDPQTKLATGTGTLILSAHETCSFKSASSQKNSNSYIGIVIGAIAGALVLAAVLVLGTLLCKKYKARIFPDEHREDDL